MKKNATKWIVISIIIIIVLILLFLIYKTVFAGGKDSRNRDMVNYKLKNNEINSVESKIKEIEEVKSVDIHTNKNSRIVKIVVILNSDVEFDKIKEVAKSSLEGFGEDKLSYYDFEFYVDVDGTESEIYPRIGYKFKANEDFSW